MYIGRLESLEIWSSQDFNLVGVSIALSEKKKKRNIYKYIKILTIYYIKRGPTKTSII